MGVVKSSGTLWMSEINAALSGGNSLSGYYRGSAAVPTTKYVVTTVTEGPVYNEASPNTTYWSWSSSGECMVYWYNNTPVVTGIGSGTTSYTVGGYTYYRGSQVRTNYNSVSKKTYYLHQIYRTYSSGSNAAINTNVPASGQIQFSQLYGAERP